MSRKRRVAHHEQQDYASGASPRPSGLAHAGLGTPLKWRSPRSESGESAMPEVTTAQQIARTVLGNLPHVHCFPCLSSRVGVLEGNARQAAQVLVVREDFSIARQACQIWGRTDRARVSGKAP
jgi:hypothetical protein